MTKLPFKVPRPVSRNTLTRRLKRPIIQKETKQTKTIECLSCEGIGKTPEKPEENCVDCKGTGKIKAILETQK